MLIRMDWLEIHRAKVDCYDKIVECINDEGKFQVIKGILKPISRRKIIALQLRKHFMKTCQIYVALAWDQHGEKSDFNHPILKEFEDVFLE